MMTEAEYLSLQAARAKARLQLAANTMVTEIVEPLQIRPFIQRRPWLSVGGAALAGFVSAMGLSRRPRTTGPAKPAGKVHEMISMVNQRLRRLATSALGALLVANLRGPSPPAATPSANGPDTNSA